jgi:Mn-dependent DtxR family transcriptional regulator
MSGAVERATMHALTNLRSDTSKLVVLYLRQVDTAAPREIADRLDLRMLTVLATLRHLEDAGVVARLHGSERVRLVDDERPAGVDVVLDGVGVCSVVEGDGHSPA